MKALSFWLMLFVACALAGCVDEPASGPRGAVKPARPAPRVGVLGSNIPRPADEAPATPTYGAGGGEALRDALGRSNR